MPRVGKYPLTALLRVMRRKGGKWPFLRRICAPWPVLYKIQLGREVLVCRPLQLEEKRDLHGLPGAEKIRFYGETPPHTDAAFYNTENVLYAHRLGIFL